MKPAPSYAEFRLRTSPRFVAAVAMLHLLVALMLLAGPFAVWTLWLLPWLGGSLWINWRRDRMPVALRCSQAEWFLVEPGGVAQPLRWLPATRVGARLTLLHARTGRRRHFWAVADDSLPADEFRRLRMLVGQARDSRD